MFYRPTKRHSNSHSNKYLSWNLHSTNANFDQLRHNCFTALFTGPPGWAGARRMFLLDFMVLGRITRGRHADNSGGRHWIRTNQQSTSINPPFLHQMPFLPQPSQFILAWDRHRNMLDYTAPWLGSLSHHYSKYLNLQEDTPECFNGALHSLFSIPALHII